MQSELRSRKFCSCSISFDLDLSLDIPIRLKTQSKPSSKSKLNQRACHLSGNHDFVGNKAKGRISKRVFEENKERQIFRKTNIFLPPDTHMYAYVSG